MKRIPRVLLILGLLAGSVAGPGTSRGQHHARYTADVDSFLADARAATEKFKRLEAAIAAGYRKVGPDFPGMGEHWVHVGRAVADELNPRRPAVLSYLRVNKEPVLTGVAYAIPLQPDESPPSFPFPGAWHVHTGTVADETLHLNPDHMHHTRRDTPRLAMIHAWIWTEHPSGVFSQDNWALPFIRLQLPLPAKIPPQAGKALFLDTGGVNYYARLIQRAGSLSEKHMTAAPIEPADHG